MKYIVFILFTVLTNAAAQLMLKQGMLSLGPVSFTAETMIARIFQILFNPWVFAGLADLRHLDGVAPLRAVQG
jgi:hypothetical protein